MWCWGESAVTQQYLQISLFDGACFWWQVDVYSFAMILFQLFEHMPPFAGVDPVEAAKAAALENRRPRLERLTSTQSPMPVSYPCKSTEPKAVNAAENSCR